MEFNKAYNRQDFVKFLQNSFLPNDYIPSEEEVLFRTQMKYSTEAVKLGTCESLDLVVYEVKHSSKNDARVSLSKEAFRMLADEAKDRALVVFVPEDCNSNYRFSFIEITLDIKEDSSKVSYNYSNPRRYSYFLGEGIAYYTPNKYLNEKGRVVSKEDLLSRFSVEVLTKEFYQELSDWYAWAIKIIRFPNDLSKKVEERKKTEASNENEKKNDKYNNEGTIRLITRLIFVWFLKQRHLIPDEFFDEKYIADNLIKDFNPYKIEGLMHDTGEVKYYTAILQNLFFAMLNSPITADGSKELTERHFRKLNEQGKPDRSDYDNNKLMRYESYFTNPQLFVELANKTVPFLNGGLFDCLDDKDNGIYFDGFSDSEKSVKLLNIPDFLFFIPEENVDLSVWYNDKRKKRVKVRGLINILKRYNFTVEENTPFDKEVSLDPELLGKVFENLLASFNPETQTTARKLTGSFYTPREIVQYMVDESLIAHLKRTVGEELEDEYRKLLRYTDEKIVLTDEQKYSVMNAIYNCRVLDPACGSGAFPVGMLQQMVHILSRLDPSNEVWKQMVLDEAVKESRNAFLAETLEEREQRLNEINETFEDQLKNPDYKRKLYLIENCLYGVDIQSIAIQICKLRFFISLVVDQKTNNKAEDNFGIRPLPNLEAKFVAANTLIGLNKKNDFPLFDNEQVKVKMQQMKEINHKIFYLKHKAKEKYKAKIQEIKSEIANILKENGIIGNEEVQQLQTWDRFDQNSFSPFFDSEWMFGVKDGFNIVIGNPPYGATLTDSDKSLYRKLYPETQFKIDTYSLFVLRSMQLTKGFGITSYILPNTLLDNYFEEQVRHKLLSNMTLYEVNDLNDKVFEGVVVHAMIILYINKISQNYDVRVNTSSQLYDNPTLVPSTYFLSQPQHMISIRTYENQSLMDKISIGCKVLEEVLDIRQAIKSGNDSIYISNYKKDDNYKPILRGKDIDKYTIKNPGLYIDYGKHLACPRNPSIFEQPKLLIREAGSRITATYDDNNFYIMSSLYNAILIDNSFDLKYLLGCINSSLFQFLMNKLTFEKTKGAFTKAKIYHYYKLPIKISDQQQKIVNVVNSILETRRKEYLADTGNEEKEIDFIVYKLYGLTFDEVLIVDPHTSITREEYERTKLE